jgi:Zn-dependent peptidase ImmA (M78 family)
MLVNRHITVGQLAASATTTVDLLALAEHDQNVAFDDLQVIARYFKRPWSYLLSDDEEVFDAVGHDNRTFANQRRPLSPEILAEMEAASMMLDAAAELFPETRCELPHDRLTTSTPAEHTAADIRAFLGVGHDEQLHVPDGFAALRLWAGALQDKGVYVSQRRLDDETIRAFSKARGKHAVIVVDTGDTAYARIFSLLHEYCHIVLRTTGVCDLDDHTTVERYCNAVSAAVLMPIDLLSAEQPEHTFGVSVIADEEVVARLSSRLRVSQAALLIRLRGMRTISDTQYETLESRRKDRRGRDGRKPGGQYYAPAINRVGRRFANNVFAALDDGKLDRQDASVLLGVNEHIVDRYRRELVQAESSS